MQYQMAICISLPPSTNHDIRTYSTCLRDMARSTASCVVPGTITCALTIQHPVHIMHDMHGAMGRKLDLRVCRCFSVPVEAGTTGSRTPPASEYVSHTVTMYYISLCDTNFEQLFTALIDNKCYRMCAVYQHLVHSFMATPCFAREQLCASRCFLFTSHHFVTRTLMFASWVWVCHGVITIGGAA